MILKAFLTCSTVDKVHNTRLPYYVSFYFLRLFSNKNSVEIQLTLC
jgi:hypothetical protein